jgi:hypothetical protein
MKQARNLVIDGKVYRNVSGYSPYYLKIKEWNALFFVTEDEGNSMGKAHIYFLDQKKDIVFAKGAGSLLGSGINGYTMIHEKITWEATTRIESVSDDRIIIKTGFDSDPISFELNIKTGTETMFSPLSHRN